MKYSVRLDENHGAHRKKKVNCPYCRKRGVWVRYYDFLNHTYLPEEYGRCDREHSCGVHNMPPITKDNGVQNRISKHLLNKSLDAYHSNVFTTWLAGIFGEEEVIEVCARYNVGTSKHFGGGTIFWQVDRRGGVRSGKVMKYKADGHREKNMTTWIHSLLNIDNFQLEQCLFGEHLLEANPGLPVVVFESEKTAILHELTYPDEFVTIACGSLNGMGGKSLNYQKVRCLTGRDVILCPDASIDGKASEHWQHIADKMKEVDIRATVQAIDGQLSHEHLEKGLDMGDIILGQVQGFVPTELQQFSEPEKLFYFPF